MVADGELVGALCRIDQCADGSDHRQNAGDVALVEDVDGDAGANQIGDDIGLQVGEGQHQVRLQRQDLWNIGRDKRRYPRLLAPNPWRSHRVAGDADDAVLFAEQIQRLDGFLGETHDSARRELAHDE